MYRNNSLSYKFIYIHAFGIQNVCIEAIMANFLYLGIGLN